MPKNLSFALVFATVMSLALVADAVAQKAVAPYSVSAVHVSKFDKMSGTVSERLGEGETGGFFNELDLSVFVVVEVTGTAEAYAPGRKVSVTASEGKRVVMRTTSDIGVINQSGRYFVPVLLPGPFCSDLTIKVRISGQSKPSTKNRRLKFICGE